MPNAIVRANAPAMSKRSPGQTGDPDAPLFALIGQCKNLLDDITKYSRLCDEVAAKEEGREIKPQEKKRLQKALSGYDDAFDEMVGTTPHTIGGLRAMLEWLKIDGRGVGLQSEHAAALYDALLASPLLATEA